MKKYFIISFLIFSTSIVIGQNSCSQKGLLFTTYENYLTKRAVDSVCLDHEKNKLIISQYNVVIKENEISRKYKVDGSLWGASRGSELFRYINIKATLGFKGYARVIYNSKGLVLYSFSEMDAYGLYRTIGYFYSLGINAEPKVLKMKNLEEDFKNSDFLENVRKLDDLLAQSENSEYLISSLFKKYYRD